MTTTDAPEIVEATDLDRSAGHEIMRMARGFAVKLPHDEHWAIQLAARHRIAALASAPAGHGLGPHALTFNDEGEDGFSPVAMLRGGCVYIVAALAHPRPAVDREAVAAIIAPLAFRSLDRIAADWTSWMEREHPNNPTLSGQILSLAQSDYDGSEGARSHALSIADAILALATPPASSPGESANR